MYTSESNQKNLKCPDLESKYPRVGRFQGWAGGVQEQPDRLVPEKAVSTQRMVGTAPEGGEPGRRATGHIWTTWAQK